MKRRRRVAETRYFRRRRGIRGGILGGTRRTTRSNPGTKVDEIRSFEALGHGISYRTRRSIARARGVRRGGGIARSVSASEAGKHRFASPVVRSGEKSRKNHPGSHSNVGVVVASGRGLRRCRPAFYTRRSFLRPRARNISRRSRGFVSPRAAVVSTRRGFLSPLMMIDARMGRRGTTTNAEREWAGRSEYLLSERGAPVAAPRGEA